MLVVGLLLVGFPDTTPVHPVAVAMLEHGETEDLDCRDNPLPEGQEPSDRPGRVAGFRLSGHFTCYRPVFTADERDPFVGRALAGQSSEAKRVAVALKAKLNGGDFAPIAIVIQGIEDEALRARVGAIYRNEIANALGPARVLRDVPEGGGATILTVNIERTDIKMTNVRVRLPAQGEIGI